MVFLKKARSLIEPGAIVACAALGLSVWQGVVTEKYYRFSLQPLFTVVPYYQPQSRNKDGIILTNAGPGVGKFKAITVTVNGKDYQGLGENQWRTILNDAGYDEKCYGRAGWPRDGDVLMAGQQVVLLAENNSCPDKPIYVEEEINVRIEYESIHEERLVVDMPATFKNYIK